MCLLPEIYIACVAWCGIGHQEVRFNLIVEPCHKNGLISVLACCLLCCTAVLCMLYVFRVCTPLVLCCFPLCFFCGFFFLFMFVCFSACGLVCISFSSQEKQEAVSYVVIWAYPVHIYKESLSLSLSLCLSQQNNCLRDVMW